MKQNLLKEMEAGSKNALLKKGSSHIIYKWKLHYYRFGQGTRS